MVNPGKLAANSINKQKRYSLADLDVAANNKGYKQVETIARQLIAKPAFADAAILKLSRLIQNMPPHLLSAKAKLYYLLAGYYRVQLDAVKALGYYVKSQNAFVKHKIAFDLENSPFAEYTFKPAESMLATFLDSTNNSKNQLGFRLNCALFHAVYLHHGVENFKAARIYYEAVLGLNNKIITAIATAEEEERIELLRLMEMFLYVDEEAILTKFNKVLLAVLNTPVLKCDFRTRAYGSFLLAENYRKQGSMKIAIQQYRSAILAGNEFNEQQNIEVDSDNRSISTASSSNKPVAVRNLFREMDVKLMRLWLESKSANLKYANNDELSYVLALAYQFGVWGKSDPDKACEYYQKLIGKFVSIACPMYFKQLVNTTKSASIAFHYIRYQLAIPSHSCAHAKLPALQFINQFDIDQLCSLGEGFLTYQIPAVVPSDCNKSHLELSRNLMALTCFFCVMWDLHGNEKDARYKKSMDSFINIKFKVGANEVVCLAIDFLKSIKGGALIQKKVDFLEMLKPCLFVSRSSSVPALRGTKRKRSFSFSLRGERRSLGKVSRSAIFPSATNAASAQKKLEVEINRLKDSLKANPTPGGQAG